VWVCVCVCVRADVYEWMRGCVRARARACKRACAHVYALWNI